MVSWNKKKYICCPGQCNFITTTGTKHAKNHDTEPLLVAISSISISCKES